jgi:hypothetical protein
MSDNFSMGQYLPYAIQHDEYPEGMEEQIKQTGFTPNILSNLLLHYNNVISKLPPEQEGRFRNWYLHTLLQHFPKMNPQNVNYNDSMGFYADRNLFKDQIINTPAESNPNTSHGTDKYKLPGHPTFSTESQYYQPGMETIIPVGDWDYKTGKYNLITPYQ